MRYFLHIAYNGKSYRGWQRQPNVVTVQEVLEKALQAMFHQKISCMGCGRTDAEVHASQFFLHIDVATSWDFDSIFRLNKMLPDDIAVFDFIPVASTAHAQLDAVERTYDYFIHFYKDPFLNNRSSLYLLKELDFEAMKNAANLLLQYTNYRSFCKRPDLYKHTLCEVSAARLFIDKKQDRLRFQITANRFLQTMIRSIMGRLLEVGKKQLSLDSFESILAKQKTLKHNSLAYPQGLYLSKVNYPYLNISPRTIFYTQEKEGFWREI